MNTENYFSDSKLPNRWKELPLIEVLSQLESGSRPEGGVRGIDLGIPSIGGEHLNDFGGFRFENIKYVPTDFFNRMRRGIIKSGDILIVKDGATTGKVSLVRSNFPYNPAVVNEHVFICRPKKDLYSEFLFYFLFSKDGKNRILENFKGSAQGGINQNFAKKTIVPIAPYGEQGKIVAQIEKLLGRLDIAKERLNRVPTIMQQFRQSTLNQIWKQNSPSCLIELKEVLSFGPQNGLYKPGSEYGTGVPIIRIDSFYDGKISHLSGLKRLNCSTSELDTYGLNVGDILINRVNSLVFLGKCGLITSLHEPTVFESNVMRCTPDITKIDGRFLTFLLCSSLIKEQILKKAKNAVNQSSINQKDVNSLQIICPPIKEQQIIVRKIDTLFTHAERIEAQVAAARERIETITQSIFYQAFTGRLIQNEETLSLI